MGKHGPAVWSDAVLWEISGILNRIGPRGRYVMRASTTKRTAVILWVALVCWMGADCQGTPPQPTEPDPPSTPVTQCDTTAWDDTLGAGFDPPAEWLGPTVSCDSPAFYALRWDSLEDDGSYQIQAHLRNTLPMRAVVSWIEDAWDDPPTRRIVLSEPTTLSNGDPAWLAAFETPADERFTVFVFAESSDGLVYDCRGFGSSSTGFNDLDWVVGICRTLCIE